ncbi:prepilin peptidase [Proteiniclasticum sp. SCR006]|uniref:Prepilin peptidase n=1 Tax=Proteiniclasticum aestuarii TaxID=2817862 RepID=A0A939KGX2_9CLOT|nr:A24 family peptidase [Proteiniclasticum aestuarii]MBO1265977.1 prepilin peptidase [Proteiniclasticum aestuarii]
MNFDFSHVVLLILLMLSVYYDWTRRKIPNKITMPAILIGVIWSTVNSGLDGFLFSVLGFLLGFAVFLVPYIYGGIGAGDVKLMAAIGSLMGWEFVLVSGLATAIFGGGLVIVYMLYKGGLKMTLIDALGLVIRPLLRLLYMLTRKDWFLVKQKYFIGKKEEKQNDYIPYALAIASGTLVVMMFRLDTFIQF